MKQITDILIIGWALGFGWFLQRKNLSQLGLFCVFPVLMRFLKL